MATSETPFQTELVKAMKAEEMHAFKASHRDMTGVLDIWCRSVFCGMWIECKFMNVDLNSFQTKKVSLTVPQHSFARKELHNAGIVATVIGYNRLGVRKDAHGLFICNPRHEHNQVMASWFQDEEHPAHIIKTRGQPWPVENLLRRIVGMDQGTLPWADQR